MNAKRGKPRHDGTIETLRFEFRVTSSGDSRGDCTSWWFAEPYHVIANSRPATPAEYAALHAELTQLGYRLKVYKRMQSRHYYDRCTTPKRDAE